MSRVHRSGFGLFQLLVVLGLFAVLLALFFPAVVKIREQANLAQSQSNMKQLGVAINNYDATLGQLPTCNDKNNFSAFVALLPYVEQDGVFNLIDMKEDVSNDKNAAARKIQIRLFLSPRDPLSAVKQEWGATNYVFNVGSKPGFAKNNGTFLLEPGLKLSTVQDGTSNTYACMETLKGDGGTKALDIRRQHVKLSKKLLDGLQEEAGVEDFKNDKNIAGDRCASWMDGRFMQASFNGARLPNDPRPDVDCEGLGGWSGPRNLDGRFPILFCDGSVRMTSSKVDPKLWKNGLTSNESDQNPDF